MKPTPTLDHIQRLTRARVCAKCPYRTPGTDSQGSDFARACESSCALFMRLPVLREAARQLDPMVGHRPRVLRRLVARIGRQVGWRRGISRRSGKRVIDLLEDLYA